MTFNWTAGLFFLALFSAGGTVLVFTIRAVVRQEVGNGKGLMRKGDYEPRLHRLEHAVFNADGYVRSRLHELANAMHIKLAKQEIAGEPEA